MGSRNNELPLCPHELLPHNCHQCHPSLGESVSEPLRLEGGKDDSTAVVRRGKSNHELRQSHGHIGTRSQNTSSLNDQATIGSATPESQGPLASAPRSQLDNGGTPTASQQAASPSPTAATTTTTRNTTTAQDPSLRLTLVALAQHQTRGTKRPYEPQTNRIGAPQTYTLNRFIDEISDIRSLALMPDEEMAMRRNKRCRAALKTRLRRLEVMIGV